MVSRSERKEAATQRNTKQHAYRCAVASLRPLREIAFAPLRENRANDAWLRKREKDMGTQWFLRCRTIYHIECLSKGWHIFVYI